MKPALRVLQPGLHTTIQDLGRFGFQRFGVPPSGALDIESLFIANALVGNPPNAPALEIRHFGPELRVEADVLRIAVAGTTTIFEVTKDGQTLRISTYCSVTVHRGDVVRIPGLVDSANAYLTVSGGVTANRVMGSASTYVRGGFGGHDGRALQGDDLVCIDSDTTPTGPDLEFARGLPEQTDEVRLVIGPQEDYFTEGAYATLFETTWQISNDADRMGLRLIGPKLQHRRGYNIITDGIATGTIQVPGSGQPIILLSDRQTTGGYPKIATVISSDLPSLGRARPGDVVSFEPVSVKEAIEIGRRRRAKLEQLIAQIRPLAAAPTLDLDALASENLVSGVWIPSDT